MTDFSLDLRATGDPFSPSFAQLPLWSIAGIADTSKVRIEIEPVGGVPVWAFVSVTNNETQHVTVVVP